MPHIRGLLSFCYSFWTLKWIQKKKKVVELISHRPSVRFRVKTSNIFGLFQWTSTFPFLVAGWSAGWIGCQVTKKRSQVWSRPQRTCPSASMCLQAKHWVIVRDPAAQTQKQSDFLFSFNSDNHVKLWHVIFYFELKHPTFTSPWIDLYQATVWAPLRSTVPYLYHTLPFIPNEGLKSNHMLPVIMLPPV